MLIDSVILFYRTLLTTKVKVGMIQPDYNVIDRVNHRAEFKQFAHRRCQKRNDVMSKILV